MPVSVVWMLGSCCGRRFLACFLADFFAVVFDAIGDGATTVVVVPPVHWFLRRWALLRRRAFLRRWVLSPPPPSPAEAQADVVMVLVSRFTAPVSASNLPSIVAARIAADVAVGHERADEVRARPQRRGGGDLPEDVARLRFADERDGRARGGCQREPIWKMNTALGLPLALRVTLPEDSSNELLAV